MSDTTYSHPLPKIDGELVLEVFTHSSLLPGDEDEPTSDEWGGGARLATLGAKVVDLVVMASLFRQQPYLGPTILKDRLNAFMEERIDQLVETHGLMEKLRAGPSVRKDEHREMVHLFCAYFGAVYLQHGITPIQDWIDHIVYGDVPNTSHSSSSSQAGGPGFASFRHASPSNSQPGFNPHFGSGFQFGQGMGSSPHGTGPFSSASPGSFHPSTSSDSPTMPTVAFVNQIATKKGVAITYTADSSGPPHQPTWVVHCYLNGVKCGEGKGKNQKLAKEEAARHAFFSMGWNH